MPNLRKKTQNLKNRHIQYIERTLIRSTMRGYIGHRRTFFSKCKLSRSGHSVSLRDINRDI